MGYIGEFRSGPVAMVNECRHASTLQLREFYDGIVFPILTPALSAEEDSRYIKCQVNIDPPLRTDTVHCATVVADTEFLEMTRARTQILMA